MDNHETVAHLTARARQGDKNAFGDLYEHCLDEVYQYVYYRVSNHQDAEDLTEHIFLKAWIGLPQLRSDVPFRAWLYRIAHNTIIDHYRTRKDPLPISESITGGDKQAEPEAQILFEEQSTRLAEVISRLSPLHQHVLSLRFINGLSTQEVARVLGRNVGTVRVLQHRALKAAQALLTAEEIVNV